MLEPTITQIQGSIWNIHLCPTIHVIWHRDKRTTQERKQAQTTKPTVLLANGKETLIIDVVELGKPTTTKAWQNVHNVLPTLNLNECRTWSILQELLDGQKTPKQIKKRSRRIAKDLPKSKQIQTIPTSALKKWHTLVKTHLRHQKLAPEITARLL